VKGRRIYNRIGALRQEQGISRKQLADIIGVNPQTVGYLEREEYNPSLDLALRVSEHFGYPVEFIFSASPLTPLSRALHERDP